MAARGERRRSRCRCGARGRGRAWTSRAALAVACLAVALPAAGNVWLANEEDIGGGSIDAGTATDVDLAQLFTIKSGGDQFGDPNFPGQITVRALMLRAHYTSDSHPDVTVRLCRQVDPDPDDFSVDDADCKTFDYVGSTTNAAEEDAVYAFLGETATVNAPVFAPNDHGAVVIEGAPAPGNSLSYESADTAAARAMAPNSTVGSLLYSTDDGSTWAKSLDADDADVPLRFTLLEHRPRLPVGMLLLQDARRLVLQFDGAIFASSFDREGEAGTHFGLSSNFTGRVFNAGGVEGEEQEVGIIAGRLTDETGLASNEITATHYTVTLARKLVAGEDIKVSYDDPTHGDDESVGQTLASQTPRRFGGTYSVDVPTWVMGLLADEIELFGRTLVATLDENEVEEQNDQGDDVPVRVAVAEGRYQPFTMPDEDDHYLVETATVHLLQWAAADGLSAALYEADDDGDPGDLIAELAPESSPGTENAQFEPASPVRLEGGETYTLGVFRVEHGEDDKAELSVTATDQTPATVNEEGQRDAGDRKFGTVGAAYRYWKTSATGESKWAAASSGHSLRMRLFGGDNEPSEAAVEYDGLHNGRAYRGFPLAARLELAADDEEGLAGDPDYDWQWQGRGGGFPADWADIPGAGGTRLKIVFDAAFNEVRATVAYTDGTGARERVVGGALPLRVNTPPAFVDGGRQSRTVYEYTDVVGAPVRAVDPDGHRVRYLLRGDAGPFTIDAPTGQIRIRAGTDREYDPEVPWTFDLRVLATDSVFETGAHVTVTLGETPYAAWSVPEKVLASDGLVSMDVRGIDSPHVGDADVLWTVSATGGELRNMDRLYHFQSSFGNWVPIRGVVRWDFEEAPQTITVTPDPSRTSNTRIAPVEFRPPDARTVTVVANERPRVWLEPIEPVVESVGRATVRAVLEMPVVDGVDGPFEGSLGATGYAESIGAFGGTGAGEATRGRDFRDTSRHVLFDSFAEAACAGGGGTRCWRSERLLRVPIVDDAEAEEDETFRVVLRGRLGNPYQVQATRAGSGAPVDCADLPKGAVCGVEITILDDEGDARQPKLVRARAFRGELALAYDPPLDEGSVPPACAFAVTERDEPVAVEGVEVYGPTTLLRLAEAVGWNNGVKVGYAPPPGDGQAASGSCDWTGAGPLRTPRGRLAAALDGESVGNLTPEPMRFAEEPQTDLPADCDEAAGETCGRLELRLWGHGQHGWIDRPVRKDQNWGSVCDDRFGESALTAAVACRALGHRTGRQADQPPGWADKAAEVASSRIWLDDVVCKPGARGRAADAPVTSLASHCNHAGLDLHNCDRYPEPHREDVFLACSGAPGLALADVRAVGTRLALTFDADVHPARPAQDADLAARFEVAFDDAGWTAPASVERVPGKPRRVWLGLPAAVPAEALVAVRYRPPGDGDDAEGALRRAEEDADGDGVADGGGGAADAFCAEFAAPGNGTFAACGSAAAGTTATLTISGEPRVASRLTAEFDGIAVGTPTYRWLRVDSDGESNPTHLERAGTIGWYYPVEGDRAQDRRIRVEATFVDAAGVERTVASGPTGAVGGCADNAVQLAAGSTEIGGESVPTTRYEGHVQICAGGRMLDICDDGWNAPGAGVACRQLGYDGGTPTYSSAFGLVGGTAYRLRRIECSGAEAALHLCPQEVQGTQTACHFSEKAGVRCDGPADAPAVIATFAGGVQHDGSAPFTLRLTLSAALDPAANLRGLLTVSNGSLGAVTSADGRAWDVVVTPSDTDPVTVSLAGSPACGGTGAVCTADGGRVAAAETVVAGALTASFSSLAAAHDGANEFTVRILFSAALDASSANVAASLEVVNGTLGTVTRVDGRYDLWDVTVTPTGNDPVTVRLRAGRTCIGTGGLCTTDGRRPASAETTVFTRLGARFTNVPGEHGGEDTAFTVRVLFEAPLDPAQAHVAAALTATGGTVGAVAPVDGRYDLFEATVTPAGDDKATVALAASPACGETGALCTAGGRPAGAAATTVWGVPLGARFTNVPAEHDAETAFTVRIELAAALDANLANVADHVTVANGTRGTVTRVGTGYDLWEVSVTPSGYLPATVRIAASPPCDQSGAMCTAGGRRVAAAETTVDGPVEPVDATFTEGTGGYDGDVAYVLLELSAPLAPSTSDVAANLTATNLFDDPNDVIPGIDATRVYGRWDRWDVKMSVEGNKPVTVSLAASPACDQTGAMCTADDPPRPVRAATATVPYKSLVTITDFACPSRHDGSSSVVVGFTISPELAASTASILDNLTVTNATIVSSGWEDGDYEEWSATLAPTGDRRIEVRLAPSGPCDEPGALCAADGAVFAGVPVICNVYGPAAALEDATATFVDVPAEHDGSTAFTVRVALSAPLDPDAAYRADDFSAANGTVGALTRVDGRHDLWEVSVTPTGDAPVTVRVARGDCDALVRPVCIDEDWGLRSVAAAEVTVPVELTARFTGVPGAHAGDGDEYEMLLKLSQPVQSGNDADRLLRAIGGGSRSSVSARSVQGRSDLFRVVVEPNANQAVTVSLPASPACGETGAYCTADGRPVPAASATVPYGTLVGVTTTCSANHEGVAVGGEVTVGFTMSSELDSSKADVLANVTLTNARWTDPEIGEDPPGDWEDDAYEDWVGKVVPTSDGDIEVFLARGPACDQPGAMCTSGGAVVNYASCTIPGPSSGNSERGGRGDETVSATFTDVPASHDGGTAFTVRIELGAAVDKATAAVADGVTATNGTVGAVTRVDGRYDLWQVSVTPTGDDPVTVALAASPPCEDKGAVCTKDGRRVAGAQATVPGPAEDPGSEAPELAFAVADERAAEGGGGLSFGVTLTPAAPAAGASVDYATSDGTAAAGEDYAAASGTLAFAEGEGWKAVVVTVLDDAADESDETLTLTLSNASGASLADATATGTIADDDQARVSVSDARGAEGGTATFEVTLDVAAAAEVTVFYTTVDGTAKAGADYTSRWGNVSFAAGETSKTIAVELLEDDEEEPDETFRLELIDVSGAGYADPTGIGTIAGDAAAPALTASFTSVPGGHNGTAFTVGLDFSAEADGLDPAWVRGTLVAAAGGTVESASRRAAPANLAWDLRIAPTSPGGDVTLSMASGTTAPGGRAVTPGSPATVPGQSLSVADATAAEGGTALFAVTLDRGATGTVTVDYATADGTATAGSDYTATSGTLTFAAGESSKTVAVPVLADPDAESEETFTLTLSNPSGAGLADASATGTIEASAAAAALTASFTSVPAGHNGTAFTAGLEFSEEIDDLGFEWVRDTFVAASGGAVEVASRRAAPANLAWDIRVAPTSPGAGVTLSMASGTTAPDGRAIVPGSPATVPGQSLSVADARAAEGGTASFAVTLDRGATGTVTVEYATADGTATAGSDYTATSGTLTFAAGESSKTVAVPLLADSEAESDETFTLTLSNPSGAALADASATGTVEDDAAPSVRLHNVPAEHGGEDQAFEAGLEFSEEIADIGYAWVRDTLATAAGGTVARAQRVVPDPPQNRAWTLTVEPSSSEDVVLGLAAGLSVPDGRPLRVGASATVRGPTPKESSVDGADLTLVWPSARDGFGTASGTDWAVAVNGAPRAVAAAEIAGRRAVLVLSAPVAAADTVTVGYVGSAMHPLADASGSVRSAPWEGVAAENATVEGAGEADGSGSGETPAPPPGPAARFAAVPADAVRLDASGLGLADLAMLAPFTALERLDLSGNSLADLSGIGAHAGVRELDLSGNRIADLDPLRALHALERLDLSDNLVIDIAPLAGLPALAVLVLDGNAVADLGPLTHLAALEHLSLADNAVPDVTPLQDLQRLRRLDLGGNPVADLSPLGDVGSLEWLALPGERAAAAEALVRLTGLRWVWPGAAPAR